MWQCVSCLLALLCSLSYARCLPTSYDYRWSLTSCQRRRVPRHPAIAPAMTPVRPQPWTASPRRSPRCCARPRASSSWGTSLGTPMARGVCSAWCTAGSLLKKCQRAPGRGRKTSPPCFAFAPHASPHFAILRHNTPPQYVSIRGAYSGTLEHASYFAFVFVTARVRSLPCAQLRCRREAAPAPALAPALTRSYP